MARPKIPPVSAATELSNYLKEIRDKIEASPIVRERWSVLEVTPSRCIDYHWDDWSKVKTVNVSGYLNSEEEVKAWLDEYEPNKGNTFQTKREYLRTFTENRWSNI